MSFASFTVSPVAVRPRIVHPFGYSPSASPPVFGGSVACLSGKRACQPSVKLYRGDVFQRAGSRPGHFSGESRRGFNTVGGAVNPLPTLRFGSNLNTRGKILVNSAKALFWVFVVGGGFYVGSALMAMLAMGFDQLASADWDAGAQNPYGHPPAPQIQRAPTDTPVPDRFTRMPDGRLILQQAASGQILVATEGDAGLVTLGALAERDPGLHAAVSQYVQNSSVNWGEIPQIVQPAAAAEASVQDTGQASSQASPQQNPAQQVAPNTPTQTGAHNTAGQTAGTANTASSAPVTHWNVVIQPSDPNFSRAVERATGKPYPEVIRAMDNITARINRERQASGQSPFDPAVVHPNDTFTILASDFE